VKLIAYGDLSINTVKKTWACSPPQRESYIQKTTKKGDFG